MKRLSLWFTCTAIFVIALTIAFLLPKQQNRSKSTVQRGSESPSSATSVAPTVIQTKSKRRKIGSDFSVETIVTETMPKQDLSALMKKAEAIDAERGQGVFRFAEPIDVDLTTSNSGTWKKLANGNKLWNLRIFSEGADSINLGFDRYRMPKGGRLTLYKTGEEQSPYRDFTSTDNKEHGQLWTPLVRGDDVILEVELPAGKETEFELALAKVNHGFRDAFKIGDSASGSCNIDVACTNAPTVGTMVSAYADQIRSVGAYTREGFDACSGALINNTNNDGTPYFLTAEHCGINASNAGSVVVYFNFQNSVCRPPFTSASGLAGNGSTAQFISGASLRAQYAPSDFCLIELDHRIPAAYNAFFAGWDRSGNATSMATGIHHPAVAEKRISFDLNSVSISVDQNGTSGATHYLIRNWEHGTTEGGSSGSPLFNENGLIIGDLTGGSASCSNAAGRDWYGAISVSWEGGGTNGTSLENWLDPIGTAPVTLNGRENTMPLPDTITDSNQNHLQDALDTNLKFVTPQVSEFSPNTWFFQKRITHDGVDAAQSAQISHNQTTSALAQISVATPDTLNFWWKVSSESSYDFLKVFVNGVEAVPGISGEQNWSQVSIPLPAGSNTIHWRYQKDLTVSVGEDAGWVDSVSLSSNSNFSPFESWYLGYVPNGYQSNLAVHDYDGDGLTNIEEYGFGSDPSLSSSANHPRILVTQNGAVFTQFRRLRPDVDYRVQTSPNLTDWTTIATNPGLLYGNANTLFDPNAEMNGKQFARILVELK